MRKFVVLEKVHELIRANLKKLNKQTHNHQLEKKNRLALQSLIKHPTVRLVQISPNSCRCPHCDGLIKAVEFSSTERETMRSAIYAMASEIGGVKRKVPHEFGMKTNIFFYLSIFLHYNNLLLYCVI
jgi:hypothetical protein